MILMMRLGGAGAPLVQVNVLSIADFPDDHFVAPKAKHDAIISGPDTEVTGQFALGAAWRR
jgi:hypothetical protein